MKPKESTAAPQLPQTAVTLQIRHMAAVVISRKNTIQDDEHDVDARYLHMLCVPNTACRIHTSATPVSVAGNRLTSSVSNLIRTGRSCYKVDNTKKGKQQLNNTHTSKHTYYEIERQGVRRSQQIWEEIMVPVHTTSHQQTHKDMPAIGVVSPARCPPVEKRHGSTHAQASLSV